MSVLLLDCGNTRIKWCLADEGELSEVNGLFYADFDVFAEKLLDSFSRGVPERCFAASVKSEVFNNDLGTIFENRLGLNIEWVKVETSECLRLAYDDISQMGVDRYLNLLGAKELGVRSALVVSAGTAVTFDALNGSEHLGGSIFPGFGLLGQVLSRDTGKITASVDPEMEQLFAKSTQEAISAGVVNGYQGAVAFIVEKMMKQLPGEAGLIITGGDADRVSSAIGDPCVIEPELLFRGMTGLI